MTDRIIIEGTAGTTPQLRTIPSGRQVANLRVASTLRRQDPSTGQWADVGTNWYSVAAWGELAAHVVASIRQGDPVLVTGRVRIVSWGDGDRPATTVEVEAETIGHSLRFGTAAFERAARAVAAPSGPSAPTDAGSADAQGWATPGAGSSEASSSDRQPALALVDAETPF